MNRLLTFTLFTFFVLVGVNYIGYKKTGVLPLRQWFLHAQTLAMPGLKDTVKILTGDETSASGKFKVSKWVDERGVVHYENRPVKGAKTLEVDPDKNILPSTPVVDLPMGQTGKSKSKTLAEEMDELRAAKHAQMEAIINK